MAETRFTRLGVELFSWKPFLALDMTARMLWLGLYASGPAKRCLPGLWQGGIGTMADAVHMGQEQVLKSLDSLIERDLVEFDQGNQVLRFIKLPDAGERAHNAPAISGWWTRFNSLPECRVRDSHVVLLRWLVEQGKFTDEMKVMWDRTFGQVQIPSGVFLPNRLFNSDTSTERQPSLFSAESSYSVKSTTPIHAPIHTSMDPPTTGSGSGSGIGSGSSFSSFSADRSERNLPSDHELATAPPAARPTTPPLALVPPYSPEQLLVALAGETSVPELDETQRPALCATIRDLDAHALGLSEIALVAKWAMALKGWTKPPSIPSALALCHWAAVPGAVLGAIVRAREHERSAAEKSAMLREAIESVPAR